MYVLYAGIGIGIESAIMDECGIGGLKRDAR